MNETPTLTTRDEWLVLIGYEAGREDGKAVTAILTDLIADLREVHTTPTRGLVPYLEGDGWCGGCGEWLPCPTLRCADRAEQRLREFGDE